MHAANNYPFGNPILMNIENNNSMLNNSINSTGSSNNLMLNISETESYITNISQMVDSHDLYSEGSIPLFTFENEQRLQKICSSLRKPELNSIFQINIFKDFVPNWKDLNARSSKSDNIFNTYTKLTKIFKKIKNKGKIKESNKSNCSYKNRLYKFNKVLHLSDRNVICVEHSTRV
jgi:hypothetical protein